MTIEKGGPWGEPATVPPGTPSFEGCAALGEHLRKQRIGGVAVDPPVVHLQDESFARLLGRSMGPEGTHLRVPVDLLEVSYTRNGVEEHRVCIDTCMIGDHVLRGELTIVSNTGLWHGRRLAPRAHPNDGRADVVTVDPSMSVRQRLLAWHRARWGTHLPHPHIRVDQRAVIDVPGHPRRLTIDGVRVGVVSALRIRVHADALILYV